MATNSVLVKKQERTFRVDYPDEPKVLIATVRYDDRCGNGHNTFAITGELYEQYRRRGEPTVRHAISKKVLWLGSCGRLHDEIAARLQELAPLIKWHSCASDEPLHYVANTVYHASTANLEAARESAIWSDATLEQLRSELALKARLPALMIEFRAAVESLGFTF
jgi:hypothetical protein